MDETEDPLIVNADSIEPKKSRWLIPIAFLVAALILIGLIMFLPPADEKTIDVQTCQDANNDSICDEPLVVVNEKMPLTQSGGGAAVTIE